MRVVIALALLLSAASADISCEDCISFANNVREYLMSDDSITEQVETLISSLCPGSSMDPADCDAGIRKYWPQFTLAMLPAFIDGPNVCAQFGWCKRTQVKVPTCEECVDSIALFAEAFGSEEYAIQVVDFLKGDGYCAGSGDADCGTAVDMLVPPALPVLAQLLVDNSDNYCCVLHDDGVCC